MSILKLPLNIDSSGKFAKVLKIDDVIKQKVLDYLSTSMFERPMFPTYGGNTNVLLYENFDPLIFEEYKLEAIQGMQRNIAGAQITNLIVNGPNSLQNDSTIKITVEYQIPTFGKRQATVDVVLPTDLNEDSPL